MTVDGSDRAAIVVRLAGVSLRYRATLALDGIDLEVPAGRMVGMLGPDGVGKSSLLSLAAGARRIQAGRVEVLGGDMASARHRDQVCPHIAYMPQGLGKNLYPTLSVAENLHFFGHLFGHDAAERHRRIDQLTAATGLAPFLDRPAGKLSGGMRQKLGLCCALIHDPDLLILDEPTTGVDPLARSQFWDLIDRIRAGRPGMSVLVATAYMEEAGRFDWLVAMDSGRLLATGTPAELRARTGADTLEAAFIGLLPEERRRGHRAVTLPPLAADADAEVAIEARDLTRRFGDFTAVDRVSFRIRRGEIFGFLGSNGCGKTTTMKMLTGLLPASAGEARLFGHAVDPHDIAGRRRVGYMSQSFSLYSELTVEQNLVLHARLFRVAEGEIPAVAAKFAPAGEILYSMNDRQGNEIASVKSAESPKASLPLMVLVDEETSGAAELLAAVLGGGVKGAMVIGRETAGDPLIREPKKLSTGRYALLATRQLKTPDGMVYAGVGGVRPDVAITDSALDETVYEPETPVLRKGHSLTDEEKEDKALRDRTRNDTYLRRATDVLLGLKALGYGVSR